MPLSQRLEDIGGDATLCLLWTNKLWKPCGIPFDTMVCDVWQTHDGLIFSLIQLIYWTSNPPAQIWGSMKFGVRSLALCCLLRWIWCYPVFTLWNRACSPRTFECTRVWYLATCHDNYTRGVFALVDDNDSIVLVTEPQIPVNIKSALASLAL